MENAIRSRKRLRGGVTAMIWLCGLVAAEGLRLPAHSARPSTALWAGAEQRTLAPLVRAELLTGEEEVLLARQIQAMAAVDQTRRELQAQLGRPPSADELCVACDTDPKALVALVKRGKHAKRAMVNANMRLVTSIARKYRFQNVDLSDLVQEGSFGLMKAAEKFDPSKGFKFSTYATWWIRQTLVRYIHDKSRNVRLPVHMHEFINKLKRTYAKLSEELDRNPSNQELAAALNVPAEKIETAMKAAMDDVSFDDPALRGKGHRGALIDTLEDEEMSEPIDSVDQKLKNSAVLKLIESLPPRESRIIKLRFGIGIVGDARTLDEVGRMMGITRERVRQLETRALDRLRQPYRHHKLQTHLPTGMEISTRTEDLDMLDQIAGGISRARGVEVATQLEKVESMLRRRHQRSIEEQIAAPQVPASEEEETTPAAPAAPMGLSAAKAQKRKADPRLTRQKKLMNDVEELRGRDRQAAAVGAEGMARGKSSVGAADGQDWEAQQRRALAVAATKAVAEARRDQQMSKAGLKNASATGVLPVAEENSLFSGAEEKSSAAARGKKKSMPVKLTTRSAPVKSG